MAQTTLDFEYGGKNYSLCITAEVLRRLDRNAVIANLQQHPLTTTEDLFVAAFEPKHSSVSYKKRKEIYGEFKETSEDGSLLEVLLEMVDEAKQAISPKGNVAWRVTRA